MAAGRKSAARRGVAAIEHANITASDGKRTADMLAAVFGWKVRWEGLARSGGYTRHVGSDDSYIAVYQAPDGDPHAKERKAIGRLNHIGVVVGDLDAIEVKVIEAGLKPFSHDDYEPGRRFYFHDRDGIEFEVISYE